MVMTLHEHSLLLSICGSEEDLFVELSDKSTTLFSMALEPLVVLGHCNSQRMLVCNSASVLAWFNLCDIHSARVPLPSSCNVEMVDGAYHVLYVRDPEHTFRLKNLKELFSFDQLKRMISTIISGLFNNSDSSVDIVKSASTHCTCLSRKELSFYTPIARTTLTNLLSTHQQAVSFQSSVASLPMETQKTTTKELEAMREWLADTVRDETGLRYSDAFNAVKSTLDALKRPIASGGLVSDEIREHLCSLLIQVEEEFSSKDIVSASRSRDEHYFNSLLASLTEWAENADRSASWRTSAEDSELINIFAELQILLDEADPKLLITGFEISSPRAIETVTSLYQLESSQVVRHSVRNFTISWLNLTLEHNPDSPMLKYFASESGGSVLLNELVRELTSQSSLEEEMAKSIITLCELMIVNIKSFERVCLKLPCEMSVLFGTLVQISVKFSNLLPLCLNLVEKIVGSLVVDGEFFRCGKENGALFAQCLIASKDLNNIENIIDAILQRYLSLTPDKYQHQSAGVAYASVVNELILLLMFWACSVADPELLEHGVVHSSDLKVLIDFCSRQLEAFEIDFETPKILKDAYSSTKVVFETASTMEFF